MLPSLDNGNHQVSSMVQLTMNECSATYYCVSIILKSICYGTDEQWGNYKKIGDSVARPKILAPASSIIPTCLGSALIVRSVKKAVSQSSHMD